MSKGKGQKSALSVIPGTYCCCSNNTRRPGQQEVWGKKLALGRQTPAGCPQKKRNRVTCIVCI